MAVQPPAEPAAEADVLVAAAVVAHPVPDAETLATQHVQRPATAPVRINVLEHLQRKK